ncbi:hypothetical protein AOLI_G00160080 [Acnodon oligacanthus]
MVDWQMSFSFLLPLRMEMRHLFLNGTWSENRGWGIREKEMMHLTDYWNWMAAAEEAYQILETSHLIISHCQLIINSKPQTMEKKTQFF